MFLSSVEPGNEILTPFDTPLGRVGSTICFDVSLARQLLLILTSPLTLFSCDFPKSA